MNSKRIEWSSILRSYLSHLTMEQWLFWGILLFYAPAAIWARFYFMDNALLEPHPWRQNQTALTILHLFQGTATLWDYRSPLGGMLWNNVYEFPLYQWVVSQVMKLGFGIEVASRLITLASFGLSALFSFFIIKEYFSSKIANWFLLIYLVNPFGVIFSRVCLIDFFALAATLAAIYGLTKLRDGKRGSVYWALFALGGLIAGLAKINIWFFITASILALIVIEGMIQKEGSRKWYWGLFGLFFLQVTLVFLWNYHRVTHLGSPADTPWLVGEFSQRFELWRWKKILWSFGARSMFYDWLTIPFLVGVGVLFRKAKFIFLIVFGVFIGHTLIFFQVQTYHDYYLIACMPYLFLVAALGLDYLVSGTKLIHKSACLIIVALMVFKAYQLKFYYSPLVHDYRSEIGSVFKLRAYTDPKDIVYWDAKQGRFEIATYSQRKVGLSETAHLIGKKNQSGEIYSPTVFHFDSLSPEFKLLKDSPKIWLDGTSSFLTYRVKEVGKFEFSNNSQLAILNEIPLNMRVVKFQENIDNCKSTTPLIVSIPDGIKELLVSADDNISVYHFPGNKRFLNIPNRGEWGCRFTLKVVS